jgi:hypothetical protein
VGLKADGTEIIPTGIDAGYQKTAEGKHVGNSTDYNLANAMLNIPGDNWDRSDETIFKEEVRRTGSYYNASNPNWWHPTELNNMFIRAVSNTGYEKIRYVKIGTRSFKDRKVLYEVFTYTTNKTDAEDNTIAGYYCGDYVFNNVYENDYIQWKFETDKIVAVEGAKRVKWENAATDKFHLSVDNGLTYPYVINSPKNGVVPRFVHIFQNGNILILFSSHVYLSTDNFSTINPVTVKAIDGSDFTGTTNSFYFFTYHPVISINGTEMFIMGTYATAIDTAHTNINVFYTVDNGVTFKSCYKAGTTNPPLLGARHVHGVSYRSYDDSFWMTTGDNESPYTDESNVIRGVYDWDLDTWTWARNHGATGAACTYKLINVGFPDSTNVLCGDDNTDTTVRNGMFTCPVSGFSDSANFVSVFKTVLGGGMIVYVDEDEILGALANSANTNLLITSKTGVANLSGSKIFGLPVNTVAFVFGKKTSDGWRLVHSGLDGVSEGDGLSGTKEMWVKIK